MFGQNIACKELKLVTFRLVPVLIFRFAPHHIFDTCTGNDIGRSILDSLAALVTTANKVIPSALVQRRHHCVGFNSNEQCTSWYSVGTFT